MDLKQFLIWLASSGGAAVALSFIAERSEKFKALPSNTKQYIQLGGSLVLALSAYAVMTYVPESVLTALLPWFQIVAGVLGTGLVNQIAHKADPARVEPVVLVKPDIVSTPSGSIADQQRGMPDRPVQPRS